MLSRKIINIYNDIARRYGNITVKDIREHEKREYEKNKLNKHRLSQQLQTTWCVSKITYL